jgi:energy-coupling factor transporter ATP-binding protein EcfA2
MKLHSITLQDFRGIAGQFDLPVGCKNLLLHGENGSAKTSIARALELLLDPAADVNLLAHKNLFGTAEPIIEARFKGQRTNTNPTTQEKFVNGMDEKLKWTSNEGKPLPSWILEGARRSAFLSYRRLLLLSDQTRDLSENFFRAAVTTLFPHLLVGTSGKTIGELWQEASGALAAFHAAKSGKGQEGNTGVTDPVAHHKPIEDALTLLSQGLGDYLLPRGEKPSQLVEEANRLMAYFGDANLKIELHFSGLRFNRQKERIEGAEILPEVSFCQKSLNRSYLNSETGADESKADHHYILNESRLTALGLALFLAALKIADIPAYIAGRGEPDEPLRLLMLDDVLVGLDYDHRMPVLDMLVKEFPNHQVLLFTHDRTWFDIAHLELVGEENSAWKTERIFSLRGRGPGGSDLPILDDAPVKWLDRAKWFLNERKDFPAAANYTRTAVEYLLKSIAHHRKAEMPFTLEPHKLNSENFLKAVSLLKKKSNGSHHVLSYAIQGELKALRKTVLNPLSHAHPNSITETEVRKAIELGKKLADIQTEECLNSTNDARLRTLPRQDVLNAIGVGQKLNAIERDIRSAIALGEKLLAIEQSLKT